MNEEQKSHYNTATDFICAFTPLSGMSFQHTLFLYKAYKDRNASAIQRRFPLYPHAFIRHGNVISAYAFYIWSIHRYRQTIAPAQ